MQTQGNQGSEHDSEYAIVVENVTKSFRMQSDRRDTFKERFVKGRSKHVHEFRALDDVSFKIKKGTTFGLIGHNGSGKSTMLKILAGVYRPTSGKVLVEDKVDGLLELGAGFHGELTGRENIYLNGAILGRSKKQIEDTMDWIIDFADIGRFIDEPVKVYSSGMTVRLGFAVAVAIQPTILAVDEIIAVGDEEFQRKCFEHMRELREAGTTIALVTHSLSLAKEMCDEVVWLEHGKVRKIGSADETISAYVSAVNAKEAEARIRQNQEIGDDEFKMNQGSGELRVTGVEIIDDAGNPMPFLKSGEPATLRIHVRAVETRYRVEVGLGFAVANGVTIAGPNSRVAGNLYDFEVGETFVDYRMDHVIYEPGVLWLTVSLVRDGHIFDYSDRQIQLTVRADSVSEQPGVILMPPGQWSSAAGSPIEISTQRSDCDR
ncbi:ABC-2 type transport system ATP-binding protein/lipopolysaccharide transport system ATP-binding protein [Actinobaculum suis]|uniref:ABC transporter ATP-binding protein n=1 Tax=Actinobaculum suis TaxID=1657 RepID=A0A1B9BDE4_9ACTO|nr:ABC transporter ATP-binding protein [Actinobaculum suis]MDY5153521.1 ABC transporter ATP-binding protein [Actinobaculum suis]OCA93475.1 ABC transporter ATP-binding protein [Actinobaculum suis]OCA95240.1 ABC transporter ATP-binding protein [Actinobaculum suis]SDE52646.1 ABC-2 type transport system ATP-binding protein/lipopolysaccharide transport system ATP-binding protein [Actinobaculum suis]VDG75929.1 ABC transporter-like protein [Actinobaculum suis]